ncbi:MAG: 50S ribosomal protein L21 [Candidatus Omnitrophica bacterium CG11_big_fil_rev_8_21_14_0_20_45_26]|uniref:Large ribosomal subunit protein bL21 n=1 Tax=Candidatus Abzuiibacterium crystallinum TaxID=1974748 RepID=A0A2H0LM61_9BACT|nr:MAG: 50S ribosomal protein L21 [Candidatus Omnitrophica bacterium CG11_big_fil_rev_8_21_14_0_20_45_26]PIW64439.1 MAG: 50S ribosomal protein L21 [Candidatus Omnitrophica bacterium CG12_big_fil_rev_8_21_14_0_65_45_16]
MERFAIIETGNRQLIVKENDVIKVQKLDCDKGAEVTLDKVLCLKNGEKAEFGKPHLTGVKVTCESLGDEKQEKVIHFTYRRRKDSRRKVGSRQTLTVLKVKSIG